MRLYFPVDLTGNLITIEKLVLGEIWNGDLPIFNPDALTCKNLQSQLPVPVLGMTLNSSVVVQGMTVKLRPCLRFRACGLGYVRWKIPCKKGCGWFVKLTLLALSSLYYIFKVRHGASVTKPDHSFLSLPPSTC